MAKPLRHTHPQPPLYLGGLVAPEAVSPDVVTQHQQALEIDYSQLTGTNPSYTKAEVDASELVIVDQEAADVAALTAAIALKAPLASPALTGVPTAPTAAPGTNSTQIATTAFVLANGAVPARTAVVVTTTSLAAQATDATQTPTLGKSGTLLRVKTDRPARVRLYATAAALTADASRLVGDDPVGESGVLLDLVTGASTLDFILAPKLQYSSDETTPVSTISMSVQNLDVTTSTVTVTLTIIKMET